MCGFPGIPETVLRLHVVDVFAPADMINMELAPVGIGRNSRMLSDFGN